MSWTDERINELSRLWQAGHSASDIGKQLGVSKNAVVGKAHRLKLPSRPSPIRNQDEESETGGGEQAPAESTGAASGAARGGGGRKRSSGGGGRSKRSKQQSVRPPERAQIEARGHRSGCLWPFGDPSESDFHFCGAESVAGKPYCREHASRAYITKSRDRDEESA